MRSGKKTRFSERILPVLFALGAMPFLVAGDCPPPEPPEGACCDGEDCNFITPQACESGGGEFIGGTCVGNPCAEGGAPVGGGGGGIQNEGDLGMTMSSSLSAEPTVETVAYFSMATNTGTWDWPESLSNPGPSVDRSDTSGAMAIRFTPNGSTMGLEIEALSISHPSLTFDGVSSGTNTLALVTTESVYGEVDLNDDTFWAQVTVRLTNSVFNSTSAFELGVRTSGSIDWANGEITFDQIDRFWMENAMLALWLAAF